jgi:hypothetical protein
MPIKKTRQFISKFHGGGGGQIWYNNLVIISHKKYYKKMFEIAKNGYIIIRAENAWGILQG